MASVNKVILIGNLTADPELKQTTNGISVASFSIAVQRRFANRNDAGAQTADFINIVAWRQQAEFICRYFKKGRPICIVGSLQSRSWTDQNGQKRYTVEVVADEVSFVERKTDSQPRTQGTFYGEAPARQEAGIPEASFVEVPSEEDLPF